MVLVVSDLSAFRVRSTQFASVMRLVWTASLGLPQYGLPQLLLQLAAW